MKPFSESRLETFHRILVEGVSKRDGSELTGHTECNRAVNFRSRTRLARPPVDVLVTESRTYSRRGEVVM